MRFLTLQAPYPLPPSRSRLLSDSERFLILFKTVLLCPQIEYFLVQPQNTIPTNKECHQKPVDALEAPQSSKSNNPTV